MTPFDRNALQKRKHHTSMIITRYVQMASDLGLTPQQRRFAIDRWKHKKRGTGGSLTVEEWEDMLQQFGGCCAFCGEDAPLTVEHVIPKSVGGGFTKENILPTCYYCNNLRGKIFATSPTLLFTLEFELYSPPESQESRILRIAMPVRFT